MTTLEKNNKISDDSEMMEIDKDLQELKSSVDTNTIEKNFWWVTLKKSEKYEVPWIKESERLTKRKWVTFYNKALVATKDWRYKIESHRETYYSQKKLPWKKLDIPGRHVAEDGTVRDEEWYIVVAAPLYIYPKGTRIMTTLWPGKVYDTWSMMWKWVDIYVDR